MKHLEKPMEFDGNLSIPNTFIIIITSWIVRAAGSVSQSDVTFILSSIVSSLGIIYLIFSIIKKRKEIKKLKDK